MVFSLDSTKAFVNLNVNVIIMKITVRMYGVDEVIYIYIYDSADNIE